MTQPSPQIIFRAIELATRFHAMQWRKEPIVNGGLPMTLPYITHPLEVAKLVWTWGAGNPVVQAAAVCHDLLEDTTCPAGEIKLIHPQVLKIVEELTFIPPIGGPLNYEGRVVGRIAGEDPRRLKREYLESFATKSVEALVIKAADRICNVQDFLLTNKDYAGRYLAKAKPLSDALVNRIADIDGRFGAGVSTIILSDWYQAV